MFDNQHMCKKSIILIQRAITSKGVVLFKGVDYRMLIVQRIMDNKNRAKICLAQDNSKLAVNIEKNLLLCISWSGAIAKN